MSKLRVSRERELEIAGLAEHLAVEHFHGERVDPEEIARSEGIAFRYEPFPEEFDGIILYEGGKFFIVCNERRSPRGAPRSRFTFAHELGHYFIDEHRRGLKSGDCPAHYSLAEFMSDVPVEKESDIFAANLLMPSASFRVKALELPVGMERIQMLSSVYGTSLTSTAFRAMALDAFPAPAAAISWRPGGELGSRWISSGTFSLSNEMQDTVKVPPPGSATATAFMGLSTAVQKRETAAKDWFPQVTGVDRTQLKLHEEVIPLGFFGWLTIVYGSSAQGREKGRKVSNLVTQRS